MGDLRGVQRVEPADADAPPTLDALQAHARAHLAGYKIPRALVLAKLERTPAGKVDSVWARRIAASHAG